MKVSICRVHGVINQDTYNKVLAVFKLTSHGDVVILHIDSVGGDIYWAEKIYEAIHSLTLKGIEIVAVGYKKIYSAALILYTSCPYRIAYKDAKFFFHKGKSNDIKELNIFENQLYKMFSHMTGISEKKFLDLSEKNSFVSFAEACELNLINLKNVEKVYL